MEEDTKWIEIYWICGFTVKFSEKPLWLGGFEILLGGTRRKDDREMAADRYFHFAIRTKYLHDSLVYFLFFFLQGRLVKRELYEMRWLATGTLAKPHGYSHCWVGLDQTTFGSRKPGLPVLWNVLDPRNQSWHYHTVGGLALSGSSMKLSFSCGSGDGVNHRMGGLYFLGEIKETSVHHSL
jgi:hypothetical protein